MVETKNLFVYVLFILIVLTFYQSNQLFSVIDVNPKVFTQWTSTPRINDANVPGWTYGRATGNEVTIKDYRFVTNTFNTCGLTPSDFVLRKCCVLMDVYKDDIKIDTLGAGWGGTEVGRNTETNKQYNEIRISNFIESWYDTRSDRWTATRNDYIISFPNASFELDISTIGTEFKVGENITLDLNILNNIGKDTKANITLDYKVPTILGEKTKTTKQEVDLIQGSNSFSLDIELTIPTELLQITPSVILYYPTENLINLNSVLEPNGPIVSVNSVEFMRVGNVIGESTEIAILTNKEKYLDQISGLNSTLQEKIELVKTLELSLLEKEELIAQLELRGKTGGEDDDDKKKESILDKYGFGGSIVIIFIITIIIWWMVRKK